MNIRRSEVARIIEEIREIVAEGDSLQIEEIRHLLERHGIAPLEKCTGEAHGNAFIDNCMQCAPRWGWVGEKVAVR